MLHCRQPKWQTQLPTAYCTFCIVHVWLMFMCVCARAHVQCLCMHGLWNLCFFLFSLSPDWLAFIHHCCVIHVSKQITYLVWPGCHVMSRILTLTQTDIAYCVLIFNNTGFSYIYTLLFCFLINNCDWIVLLWNNYLIINTICK